MNEWSIIDINSLIHDFKNWLNVSDDLFSSNHQQIQFQEFLYCAWYLVKVEEEEAEEEKEEQEAFDSFYKGLELPLLLSVVFRFPLIYFCSSETEDKEFGAAMN